MVPLDPSQVSAGASENDEAANNSQAQLIKDPNKAAQSEALPEGEDNGEMEFPEE